MTNLKVHYKLLAFLNLTFINRTQNLQIGFNEDVSKPKLGCRKVRNLKEKNKLNGEHWEDFKI